MQADFWHDMWASGVVGFHQTDINEFLRQHWNSLGLTGSEKVLVPLCGKSLDMLWLAQQGHAVLGVELSQQALDEFVAENELSVTQSEEDDFAVYQLQAMTLLCGDFFKLNAGMGQDIGAVYDRAAIVALPPQMRQDYVQHLFKTLPSGTPILMVTMEYDQSQLQGPPFSVPEEEVRSLFAQARSIETLSEVMMSRKGVSAQEKVFKILL